MSIKEAKEKGQDEVTVKGWVYRERGSNKMKFIVLRDSTGIIQCVISREEIGENNFSIADKIQVETSMEITGQIKKDERAPTGYEIKVTGFKIIGESHEFPIQKDKSREFLDDNRHLWLRSRKMTSILKIRSSYIQAREEFFRKEGFFRFDAPVLQPSQCEGGATLFEVKYYNDTTYLSQSWQLYAEAAVFALEKVYNLGPTFRAEKSKTSRHLSEFWMAEMEAAWFNLYDVTEFAKKELKYCIKRIAEERKEELEYLGKDPEKLKEMTEKEWPSIKYREALKILNEKENMEVPFGKDLRTIEEQKLMNHFDVPVAVTHYPKEEMAFYKPADPEQQDEALCFDMLAPEGYGEIIGGSERSTSIEEMRKELEKEGENIDNYQWYFDLRRYGSVPHSGYGIGLERVLAWLCGLDNIKDAIPFPRTMQRYTP